MSSLTILNKFCSRALKPNHSAILSNVVNSNYNFEQRNWNSKHWNPKFAWLRSKKVIKVKIPNFHEKDSEITPQIKKQRMREKGFLPPRPWIETPMVISSTTEIHDPYVPPEGDGKSSVLSTAGAKQNIEFVGKKSRSYMAVRKIREYEEDFKPAKFAEAAQEIYIKSHEALMAKEKEKLKDFVTERAYPEMIHNTDLTTIRWKFLKSLEPPRVVHARYQDVVTAGNMFAQVTVRMHTQQTLAIYDRFGRLMHGSEILAKDVLEYVVFEKHITNEYGLWRLHAKIVPDWLAPREPRAKTHQVIEEPEENDSDKPTKQEDAIESVQLNSNETKQTPLVAN